MFLKTHNRVELLASSANYIAHLKSAIDSACECVFLETYIFANDSAGNTIAQALQNAARRGVSVNVILDGFGAKNAESDFAQAFQNAGVRLLFFRQEKSVFSFKRQRLRRLHSKLAIIDYKIAFVGGMNIDADPKGTTRLDFAARIEGEVLTDIARHMLRQWQNLCRAQGFKRDFFHCDFHAENCIAAEQSNAEVGFLIRDNFRHRHDILNSYLRAIESAKKEIIIANAYFLPGFWLSQALLNAASRGVKIRIILQGKSNVPFLLSATRFLYQKLIQAGIEIYEYQPGLLHAKVATIDERWLTIGSSNMDPFSLLLNKEANILVLSNILAKELKKKLELTMANDCVYYSAHAPRRQSFLKRTVQALSFWMIRAILKLLHYNQSQWDDHQKRF